MTRSINGEARITVRPIIEQLTVAVVRRIRVLNLRPRLSSARFREVFPENNLRC